MCGFVENGIRMEDGTVYPLNTKLEHIAKSHYNELVSNHSSMMDSFLLHGKLDNILNKVEALSEHGMGCPINVVGIQKIARKEIKWNTRFKYWWEKKGWMVKAITGLFALVTGGFGLFIAYKEVVELIAK